MVKLSEVKGQEAFSVAGDLLGIIGRIIANRNTAKAMGHNLLEFFGAAAKNTPKDLKALIEAVRGEKIPDEDFTALRVILEINELANNEEIISLFV